MFAWISLTIRYLFVIVKVLKCFVHQNAQYKVVSLHSLMKIPTQIRENYCELLLKQKLGIEVFVYINGALLFKGQGYSYVCYTERILSLGPFL